MCGREEALSDTSSMSKNTAPSILSLRYSCLALRDGSMCQEAGGGGGGGGILLLKIKSQVSQQSCTHYIVIDRLLSALAPPTL